MPATTLLFAPLACRLTCASPLYLSPLFQGHFLCAEQWYTDAYLIKGRLMANDQAHNTATEDPNERATPDVTAVVTIGTEPNSRAVFNVDVRPVERGKD